MRALGIVCEYNPFHRGHGFQLRESRRLLGEEAAVVCVLSGDFVQRGEGAVYDKFARAEAACRCGADVVAELPLPWCLSSAEGFAAGAVSVLSALGCDTLSFGSESGSLESLERLAAFLSRPETLADIRESMARDQTLSFARARQLAAERELGSDAALLSEPNDILAVEYLRAVKRLGLKLEPLAVRRLGQGHDSPGEGAWPSAMALRERLERGEDITGDLPEEAAAVYAGARTCGRAALEIALLSRLYTRTPADFDALPDSRGGAGRRLYKALEEGGSLAEIAQRASGKRFTAARMRRMLLCAALGLRAEDAGGLPPYLRILAMSERGRAYLHDLEEGPLPLVSRPAELRKIGGQAERVFALGAAAHDLYGLPFVVNGDKTRGEDWKTPTLIVQN